MLMLLPNAQAISFSMPLSVLRFFGLTELEKTCCGVERLDRAVELDPLGSEIGKDASDLDMFSSSMQ